MKPDEHKAARMIEKEKQLVTRYRWALYHAACAYSRTKTDCSEYVPPEVASGLMIPAGKWFKARFDRFKQTGQHVQIASAEISLF